MHPEAPDYLSGTNMCVLMRSIFTPILHYGK